MPYGPNYTLTPASSNLICGKLNTLDYMAKGNGFERQNVLDDDKKTQNYRIYIVNQLPQRELLHWALFSFIKKCNELQTLNAQFCLDQEKRAYCRRLGMNKRSPFVQRCYIVLKGFVFNPTRSVTATEPLHFPRVNGHRQLPKCARAFSVFTDVFSRTARPTWQSHYLNAEL